MLPNNLWLDCNEMAALIPHSETEETNVFVTCKGIQVLRDQFAMEQHEKFGNVLWSFLQKSSRVDFNKF
jgi:hypothetical protein